MKKLIIYGSIILALASSCSVAKYLPPGEKLYRGATVTVERHKDVKTSEKSLRKQLKQSARPKTNKFILGQPYKVWWWYVIGEPKREKGLKAFLRNKLGEPPVLSSRVNAPVTAENMNAYLENLGYFHSAVTGDTINSGYFTKAIYKATVLPQHTLRNITWVNDSTPILKILSGAITDSTKRKIRRNRSLLKTGMPYRLSDIQAERERLDLRLKTKGYYFFNPDFIMAYADSTIGNYQVDLFLNLKNNTPQTARNPYKINRITVFPNYTLLEPPPDTSKAGTVEIDGINIRDTVHKFKHDLFKRSITYRPGATYSSIDQNTTLNRFINLGAFKFTKNRYEAVKDSADPYKLNVFYYLTPAKKKSLQAELDGFSKENKYIGSQLSINWRNRNTFKGSELFTVRAYGSFEISPNDSLKKNNNYRLGVEASMNFPQYIIPFIHIREKNLYPARTQFLLGYEYFIKQSFYTKNVFRFNYEFQWKESANKQHILAPVSFTYLSASNVTDSFYKAAALNPSLLSNVYNETILGSYYTYTFNTLNPQARHQWYFNAGLEAAGNIIGAFARAKEPRTKTLFGTPFAQYIKADGDLRYTKRFRSKIQWANRIQIGVSMPYNNSAMLPFSKQYLIGGSSSVRAFSVRSLGPGSYLPTAYDKAYFQTIGGDYKLLFNSELRIPLFGRFNGAVFADIGNIWTKDTLLFGKAGQLKKDFYKELAVAGGVGLRVDATVILIRFDLGIPLRKPYLPDGQRWVFDKIDFGSSRWRGDNLVLNIAIGYPF
jgi:outer membrane protein insertion porin family